MATLVRLFGTLASGQDVHAFFLSNSSGMSVEILSYGAIIRSILAPDRHGVHADVCLGMDSLAEVVARPGYNGAVIGRIANRTANARYALEGRDIRLEANWQGHNLHSGSANYARRLFSFDPVDPSQTSVTLRLDDQGEGGFGTPLDVSVTYSLEEDNSLVIRYRTFTNHPCVVALTNHVYLNLGGHDSGPVYDHHVQLEADFFTPGDADHIPTGEILNVSGTPFDLRQPVRLGDVIADPDFDGYDHNFVLKGDGFRKVSTAFHDKSGRMLETWTDLPGLQFYTSCHSRPAAGKGNASYDRHHAICLETQYFPNSVNTPHFPSPVQKAGESRETVTAYRFSTMT